MSDYPTLYDRLLRKYDNSKCPAEGLFWTYVKYGLNKSDLYGLRLEAPDIMLEFKDNVNLGTDPAGDLFFYDVRDFTEMGEPKTCYYKVLQLQKDIPERRALHVKFYLEKGGDSAPIAEFLALDPKDALNGWKQIAVECEGKWEKLKSAASVASLYKPTTGTELTIKIEPIGKRVTFTPSPPIIGLVSLWGNLTFKDLKQLTNSKAKWVDYNSDRIIFYETEYDSKDFAAYFIRNKADPSAQDIEGFGKVSSAKWSDL